MAKKIYVITGATLKNDKGEPGVVLSQGLYLQGSMVEVDENHPDVASFRHYGYAREANEQEAADFHEGIAAQDAKKGEPTPEA
jgi:hypothetical protein